MKQIHFYIPDQFGYSAGYLYYTKYLVLEGYDVYVHCIDKDLPKISHPNGVKVDYLEDSKSQSAISNLLYLVKVFRNIISKSKKSNSISIIKHFPLCSLILLKTKEKNSVFLDIRTGAITKNRLKQLVLNAILFIDSTFFQKGFILSELMREKLNVSPKKYTILPLGADIISSTKKNYVKEIHLIYVGTLNYREIYKTVRGLSMVIKEINLPVKYDIIGYGTEEEEKRLIATIKQEQLCNYVSFLGRKSHKEIRPYLEKANIGVCYVPKTRYYDTQPPTKIYEYTLSGLFVLATNTEANKQIINSHNGLLHEDSSVGFAGAILEYIKRKQDISEDVIRKSLISNTWDRIVKEKLMNRIIKDATIKSKN